MEIITPKCAETCNESAVGFWQLEEEDPQGACWRPACPFHIFKDGRRICFIIHRQAELKLSG